MVLPRWSRADHPVATAVFAVAMVVLGIAVLGLLILMSSLDDMEFFPDCLGNC